MYLLRDGEPPVVAVLVLAEPSNPSVLVEVRPGGAAASRPGPVGAAGLPPAALGPRCSRCLAPQHHPSALPFLQVCRTFCFIAFPKAVSQRERNVGHKMSLKCPRHVCACCVFNKWKKPTVPGWECQFFFVLFPVS